MKATRTRSIFKTVSWRIVAIAITFGVLYPLLGWHMSVKVTIIAHTVKTVVFYLFERVWSNVPWGYE
jgi:uncharacterized membrane protein